jgi:hypothetical protein
LQWIHSISSVSILWTASFLTTRGGFFLKTFPRHEYI